MPQLEAGDLGRGRTPERAATFAPYIADGYDVVTLTASCGLMMKFEWPLILPENEAVRTLSGATQDICEYVVGLSKAHGLAGGLSPIDGNVTLHHACHARAQNMGAKSAEMLRLIPGTKVDLVERCSGHGGTFGVMKLPACVQQGRPSSGRAVKATETSVDCPLPQASGPAAHRNHAEGLAPAPGPPHRNLRPRLRGVLREAMSATLARSPCRPDPDADYARNAATGFGPAAQAPAPVSPAGLHPDLRGDTMLFQVQEMLLTERAAEQVPDELAAYNLLIPQA